MSQVILSLYWGVVPSDIYSQLSHVLDHSSPPACSGYFSL